MSHYTNAVSQAVEKSRLLVGLTRDLEFKRNQIPLSNPTERAKVRDVIEHCNEVLNETSELERDGKRIRDRVDRFKRAAAKGTNGRTSHVAAAREYAKAVRSITVDAQKASEIASEATGLANSISQKAVETKEFAAVGNIERAVTSLNALNKNIEDCEARDLWMINFFSDRMQSVIKLIYATTRVKNPLILAQSGC
jgi:myosin heavy subunit